ncbi:MAG: SDR family NAD(P)-dependent oxidoreductase [Furfurilactobacillus sp.]|uniref:SDR family NAD(P)-dependent oxidoreductase n=1 Tax=Furfurilactobacillus milii TaxID=2888272 RepID=A0ABT6D960_9LACO|nr:MULTISPECIES: SDR family NAD(P)-dependent oxidoreductase [Furfurilactobacillus]QLE65780.1 short-chain dehydrogenase-reductase SDR [Furfurilactobacillus rossiae]MCF6160308.1 SDR family NAD(P)-dependent oxidoreductase [Furfurilactobacillus milii]MCF6162251.1 SDR family NAD(P)-dependent oxidoreductase [Furfurilactobacillus milii]MCF6420406.1 SDR family NAD(P)-dependent oxidoreductase [Furfurilactobacillus milii]MCH4012304.1 SDR family NAD(P)-dependent oxidoreductase [Furfurilactobacillus sp.]
MSKKTILITGASSGMGYAATKLFAQQGWTVYAGARRVEKIPTGTGIHPVVLDVTDDTSRKAFVRAAKAETTIDVLLNNAGYGEYGPLEEVDSEKSHKQVETNLFGAAELTKLVLPSMRRQQSGRIVNISSIGGDVYSALGGWYHVTKHALNVWSDVLDTEIQQFGLRSVVVEPGGTQSSWSEIAMGSINKNVSANTPYQALIDGTLSMINRVGSQSSATSEELAKVFYRAATDDRPKLRYYFSIGDRMMAHFARVHPNLFHRTVMSMVKRATK